MKALKIKAKTMRQALAEARRRLGDGARALHTKQYEEPVLFGLLRRSAVEILAAADLDRPGHVVPDGHSADIMSGLVRTDKCPENSGPGQHVPAHQVDTQRPLPNPPRNGEGVSSPSVSEGVGGRSPADIAELARISEQIEDIRHILARVEASSEPKTIAPTVERLVRNGVSEQVAEALAANCAPEQAIQAIKQRLRCAGPIKCDNDQARIALVGPTGSGKTTTAAKLASQYVLIHKKTVALLTLDTYRIGAVEQLATYARILNAPLEVALCPEDVEALVARHGDKDLIIIDTVGRSQRDKTNLDELQRMLRYARPTETHLAISAQACPAAQKEAVSAFTRLGVDRLILTKLDECPLPGCALDLAVTSLLPFSYLTFGQEVPDDITLAGPDALAKLVWEGTL